MFVDTLRQANVTYFNSISTVTFAFFGFFLWGSVAALYSLGIVYEERRVQRAYWIVELGVHALVGILVCVEALFTEGMYWPLQLAIIGLATYITFTLPAFVGIYLIEDNMLLLGISSGALAAVCISNATMMAILFEYFHRKVRGDGGGSYVAPSTNSGARRQNPYESSSRTSSYTASSSSVGVLMQGGLPPNRRM